MPRVKQFDKAEVLEKAKDLFWRQGYHATSVQNLVNHLGINRGSLYDTFGGKNELYEAAFKSYRTDNADFLQNHFDQYESVSEAVKDLLLYSAKNAMEDPDRKGCFVVNCTTEYLPHHKHFLPELLKNKSNFENTVGNALRKAVEKGEFSSKLNIAEVTSFLFTFMSGLNVIAKVEQSPQAIEDMIEVALKVLN